MQTYLDEIKDYNTRQVLPRPGKCALLVIDMQNYFLPMASPHCRECVFNCGILPLEKS